MKTTSLANLAIAAAMVVGASTAAHAETVRDHRKRASDTRDHRQSATPARRVISPPQNTARSAPRQPATGYYHNGIFVRDVAPGERVRDPMTFRYPGVAAPLGPVAYGQDAQGTYMWIDGYWDWHGKWVWVEGYWAQARPGYTWRPVRFVRRGASYQRIPGAWVPVTRDHRHPY